MSLVQEFLSQYRSVNTQRAYHTALNHFLSGKDQNTYFDRSEEEIQQDVVDFFISIRDRPPKTVVPYLCVVRLFLSENDVEFTDKFWRGLRRKVNGS